VGGVALAVASLIALATLGAPAAQAEVCTGGYPSPASGTVPTPLLSAVAILRQPHYAAESLPQWKTSSVGIQWGNEAASGWYANVTLADAQRGASWWVMPTQSCGGVNEVCLLAASELTLVSFDCLNPSQIAGGSQPHAVDVAGQWLISGFAPGGAGSVVVEFAHGTRVWPASGGVYDGRAPASLGAVRGATFQAAPVSRPVAPVVIVDQTGMFSSSQGPLASTGRLRVMARTLRARVGVTPTILGTAVRGHRARTAVLYAPGQRRRALSDARALNAPSPRPLSRAELRMFGPIAGVVVLAGKR
jgi:hypothetical protein